LEKNAKFEDRKNAKRGSHKANTFPIRITVNPKKEKPQKRVVHAEQSGQEVVHQRTHKWI